MAAPPHVVQTPPKPPVSPVPPPRAAAPRPAAGASAPLRPRAPLSLQELVERQAAVIDANMRVMRAQVVLLTAYQDLLALAEEP